MSDYNKYVTAVNKIFEVAGKLKLNYPDNDNLGLIESIEDAKSAVVDGAKLFSDSAKPQTPPQQAQQPTSEPPKAGV